MKLSQNTSSLVLLMGLLLSFTNCKQTWQRASMNVVQYTMSDDLPADSNINNLIIPYRTALSEAMNVVIGHSEVALIKDRPEGTLNNFVADLLYERATHYFGPIDLAVASYGGLRIPSISEGPITVGKIYELMPFDNEMVILKMNGELLQQLLDRIAEKKGWPISKELRFRMQDNKATEVLVNGVALHKDQIYTICLPDYIANGGDDCDFLKAAERTDLHVLVRDAILEYVKLLEGRGEHVNVLLDGRLVGG